MSRFLALVIYNNEELHMPWANYRALKGRDLGFVRCSLCTLNIHKLGATTCSPFPVSENSSATLHSAVLDQGIAVG